jgi:peptidoglycan/xylan/chitin deacetylase (PgdA/CDA1 family)
MSGIRTVGYGILGGVSRAATGLGIAAGGLRVLAYHDVPSDTALHAQLQWLQRHFDILTLDAALEARGNERGGDRSALVTFDDADPSVVERGLPVLDALGIEAVLFVCPGVVDTTVPYWWQVVQLAVRHGIDIGGRRVGPSDVLRLKAIPDNERREEVSRLTELIEVTTSSPVTGRQVTTEELRSWTSAGHAIGNHTWDHPILDTADPAEQARQIERAHSWLEDRGLMSTPVFAYPNGNGSTESRSILDRLGYAGAMLFDHRIDRGGDRLGISRLRVNGEDDPDVFVSKLSGLHPLIHRIAGRP